MRFPILITACLILTATLALTHDAHAQQPTGAQETSAALILLPTSLPGTVAFPHCDSCETRQYTIDANTHLYIGETPVSLDHLRAEFAARPRAIAMVSITNDGSRIRTIFIVQRRLGE